MNGDERPSFMRMATERRDRVAEGEERIERQREKKKMEKWGK